MLKSIAGSALPFQRLLAASFLWLIIETGHILLREDLDKLPVDQRQRSLLNIV